MGLCFSGENNGDILPCVRNGEYAFEQSATERNIGQPRVGHATVNVFQHLCDALAGKDLHAELTCLNVVFDARGKCKKPPNEQKKNKSNCEFFLIAFFSVEVPFLLKGRVRVFCLFFPFRYFNFFPPLVFFL